MNTLISEIEYNPENAVVFTQKLSDVYRYILKSQEQGLVTLRDELEFLDGAPCKNFVSVPMTTVNADNADQFTEEALAAK